MIYNLYVSGYSSEYAGIYQIDFHPEKNSLDIISTNNESLNPVHILVKDDILFSANEIEEVARISSFKINADKSLKLINRIDGVGHQTCDISLNDNVVYGANYGSGNIFSVAFEDDGTLIEVMSNMEHIGKEPRAHSTILSKNQKYLYEANLGLDKIFIYEVYPEGILRALASQRSVKLADFEGPRHMSISQDGKYLYIVNEFGNSVYSYLIDEESGKLTFIDKINLVDDVECYAADIHFSKDERFIYVSLRGVDEIVQIKIDEGKMEIVSTSPSYGRWPRSFKISDDNEYMFITNQHSNNLVVLKIDQNDGTLSDVIAEVEIFSPTSVALYNK